MLESLNSNKFEYTKLTEEEQQQRGILGRLTGIIADTKNATRNGRKYSKELWEKVFENPIMQEKIKNRCCFGELGHPSDREEIDMEKIAVCLAETPKVGKDGNLYGVFDILSTPNGKILKSLCDYGCTVGVSSRGTGDLYTDEEGNEAVDPDTYDCECWDVVLIPAVESARMQYVTESLSKDNSKGLKQALIENLNTASSDDQKIMKETLHNLNIDITTNDSDNIEQTSETAQINESKEVSDTKSKELLKSLQEAVVEKAKIEKEVKSLQEQLAVSNTKVNQLEEEVKLYKQSTIRLTDKIQSMKQETTKESKVLEESVTNQEKHLKILESRCSKLLETSKQQREQFIQLNEELNKKDATIDLLNAQLTSAKEAQSKQINKLQEDFNNKEQVLKTQLENTKQSLTEMTTKAEKYKKTMNNIVEKYISSKATMLGISSNEIKNRLSESYTLTEIDKVCEELQNYQLNIDKLPFEINNQMRVKITESKPIKSNNSIKDDDIDEDLFRIAGLTK